MGVIIVERKIICTNGVTEKTRFPVGANTKRLPGKQIGRAPGTSVTTGKSVEAKKLIKKYSRDFDGSLADKDVIKLVGISRNSYYKYKRELSCP